VKKLLRRFFGALLECAIRILPHLAAWVLIRLRS
jgi:hypothetical protein